MSRPFPKVVYLKLGGNDGEPYLVAEAKVEDLTETDTVHIGAYRLVDEYDVRAAAELRRKGSKRWIR